MTLYRELLWAEQTNNKLKEIRTSTIRDKSLDDWVGRPVITIGELTPEELTSLQRKLIQSYEKNPVLQEAISGKKSIEETVTELSEHIYKPVRRLFPKFKDKKHNARVEDLSELISESSRLWTGGNFLSGSFVGSLLTINAMAYAVGIGFEVLNYVTDNNLEQYDSLAISGIMGLVIGSFIACSQSASYIKHDVSRIDGEILPQAKYIDRKIKELM